MLTTLITAIWGVGVFALGVLGFWIIAAGTTRAFRAIRKAGQSRWLASGVAMLTCVALTLGGWFFLGLYWAVTRQWPTLRDSNSWVAGAGR